MSSILSYFASWIFFVLYICLNRVIQVVNMTDKLTIIILAAGNGTRMKSTISKVCHHIGGKPMLQYVLETAKSLQPTHTVTVVSNSADDVRSVITDFDNTIEIAIQEKQLGTAHAVLSAKNNFHDNHLLVMFGDTPLVKTDTLQNILSKKDHADIIVLGLRPDYPNKYGRIITNGEIVTSIVEYADANDEEKATTLCNSGIMLISPKAGKLIEKIDSSNKSKEFYLTDLIALANQNGLKVIAMEGPTEEFHGINNRADLAMAEYIMQTNWREHALLNGATLIDPNTTYFSHNTVIGQDVTISPNVVFGPNVVIEDNVTILPFCRIENAVIKKGARVGPFAHIRPGTVIEQNCHIGNFVEIKNTLMKAGAKANHLTYLGDSEVGERTNIGAGTITCNYDGYNKNHTKIGDDVFVGSNTCIIAPVEIGNSAVIGAGSIITKRVLPDSLAYSRSPQENLLGAATRYRKKRSKLKVLNETKE